MNFDRATLKATMSSQIHNQISAETHLPMLKQFHNLERNTHTKENTCMGVTGSLATVTYEHLHNILR